MSQLGLGVMIQMLGGNKDTVDAIQGAIGKTIAKAWLESDELRFEFSDGTKLTLLDAGQSCCESRYMHTDDDLPYYTGSKLLGFELKDGPTTSDEYSNCHEIQFLAVKTDRGEFTMSSHNEHNGYYGGFYIQARAS